MKQKDKYLKRSMSTKINTNAKIQKKITVCLLITCLVLAGLLVNHSIVNYQKHHQNTGTPCRCSACVAWNELNNSVKTTPAPSSSAIAMVPAWLYAVIAFITIDYIKKDTLISKKIRMNP